MTHRFFLDTEFDTQTVQLEGSEAHHLLNVMRHKVGDVVQLFDGKGKLAEAEIVSHSRKSVELQILKTTQEPNINRHEVILATAVPKGDRFRFLVEKATELGVDRLVPLRTEHSVVDPRENKLDKLRQTVVSAAKQCGRNRLMLLEDSIDWPSFLDQFSEKNALWVAHPAGITARLALEQTVEPASKNIVLAVGPEGGFSDSEIEQAVSRSANLVSLGATILRTETAALAMATLFGLTGS